MGVTYTTNSATTYVPIATNTLGSATHSITFSSIPSTYTDLVLIVSNCNHSYVGSTSIYDLALQFNADTASNYATTSLIGNGTTATTGRTSDVATAFNWAMASANPGNAILQIQNYSNTTTYKTVITRSNVSPGSAAAFVSQWRNISAITSITLSPSGTYTMSANSTFTLYGIKAA